VSFAETEQPIRCREIFRARVLVGTQQRYSKERIKQKKVSTVDIDI